MWLGTYGYLPRTVSSLDQVLLVLGWLYQQKFPGCRLERGKSSFHRNGPLALFPSGTEFLYCSVGGQTTLVMRWTS